MQKVVVPAVVAMPDNACLLLVSVVQIPYSYKKNVKRNSLWRIGASIQINSAESKKQRIR
jgi:hypothetical protein